jgi:hypothetical protein
MRKEVEEYLEKYNAKENWPTDEDSLVETILNSNVIWEEETGGHRWYNDSFRVVKIGDKYFGYDFFETTGDDNWIDMGLEFDNESIVEVKPVEKVIIVYEKI